MGWAQVRGQALPSSWGPCGENWPVVGYGQGCVHRNLNVVGGLRLPQPAASCPSAGAELLSPQLHVACLGLWF